MKKHRCALLSVCLLVIIFVLCLNGCSRVMRYRYLGATINNTGWVPASGMTGSYKFEHERANVVLCPKGRGPQGISFGPVFLPVIPFPATPSFSDGNFFMHMAVEKPTGISIGIDLSKIKIELPNGRILPVNKVSGFKFEGEYVDACMDFKGRDERRQNQLDIGLFVMASDRMSFFLEFDIPDKDVQKFILDIGSLTLGDKNINLPPLEYDKASKYEYVPFFLPLPT